MRLQSFFDRISSVHSSSKTVMFIVLLEQYDRTAITDVRLFPGYWVTGDRCLTLIYATSLGFSGFLCSIVMGKA